MPRFDAPTGYVLPKLGPGLKAVLAVLAGVAVVETLFLDNAVVRGAMEALVCVPAAVLHGQVWRLLTAGVLSDVQRPMGLILGLVGLYFLSADLEARWGTRRFLVFLASSVVAGNVLAVALDALAPRSLALFHPPALFGPTAALSATAIAWSIANRQARVLFMMIVPVSGRVLFWITVVGAAMLLFSGGDATALGGVLAGMAMTGEPSPLRRVYLHAKLAVLRRRGVPTARAIATGKGPRPRRAGGPDLRVVPGGKGRDDHDWEKREPPKDKRYLN